MQVENRQVSQSATVYLYDPIPLDKVSLDSLKSKFSRVISLPDQELILAETPERKIKAQIQSARAEFSDETGSEFSLEHVKPIPDLLQAMPPLNVRAFGVNLHVRVIVGGNILAGQFVTERLLAGWKELQEKLGARIIASASRFTYGEPSNYFDLRVTPLELTGNLLHLQLHKHKDMHLTDSERIVQETNLAYEETREEFARIGQIL